MSLNNELKFAITRILNNKEYLTWELKSLGEISTKIYRGSEVTNSQIGTGDYPCTTFGSISNAFSVWFEKCNFKIDPKLIKNPKYFESGDLLMVVSSQVLRCVGDCCAYLGKEKAIAGSDISVIKHTQNPKYLSYALSTEKAKLQKHKLATQSAVVHLNLPEIKKLKIPIPSLEIQKQISEFLDLLRELIRELSTELVLRKKQYEYYLNKLIKGNFPEIEIGEVCNLIRGFSFDETKYKTKGEPIIKVLNVREGRIDENEMVYFDPEDYSWDLNRYLLSAKEVCITTSGASSGKIAINRHNHSFYISSTVCKLEATEKINSLFLYFCLRCHQFEIHQLVRGGAVKGLPVKDFQRFKIPLPDIDIQEQIANTLDQFRELCEDLEKGIPKEIEMWNGVYEYYRDLLIDGEG